MRSANEGLYKGKNWFSNNEPSRRCMNLWRLASVLGEPETGELAEMGAAAMGLHMCQDPLGTRSSMMRLISPWGKSCMRVERAEKRYRSHGRSGIVQDEVKACGGSRIK
jgi:hypothetical protein